MSGYYGTFVVPTTLATPAELAAWTGQAAPANASAYLRGCTSLVLSATLGAYYDVDPLTGIATATQPREAMRDAVCIQAAAWIELGINPLTGGIITSSVKQSKKIGSASITYADTADAAAARAHAYRNLVPEAEQKLAMNNLLGYGPAILG